MLTPQLQEAIRAAQDHKAVELSVLDLRGICSFTDYFIICGGTSTRHAQAICDAVVEQFRKSGVSPTHAEGYARAEWILVDCLDFVVHIFSGNARQFYDLERLWKTAKRVPVPAS